MIKWISGILVFVCLLLGLRVLLTRTEIRNADPSGSRIICFGDSLTFGTGAPEGLDYPSVLSEMIGKPIINAGVPGDTTADALKRLREDVLSKSPGIVLITLGGNDLKNRVSKTMAFDNLKQIVAAIQDQGALVIIGGLRFPLYDRGFSEGYNTLAEETGSVLIENIYAGIMGNRELMSDPIHPNEKGYAKMAKSFYDALEPYLKNLPINAL